MLLLMELLLLEMLPMLWHAVTITKMVVETNNAAAPAAACVSEKWSQQDPYQKFWQIWSNRKQHNTTRSDAALHDTAQHNPTPTQRYTTQQDNTTTQHNKTTPHNVTQSNVTQHDTAQHNTTTQTIRPNKKTIRGPNICLVGEPMGPKRKTIRPNV